MRWPDVQATYPDQWLVIEALEAHTEGNRRILDHIAVVEVCPDSVTAMQTYCRLHQQYPLREFYFVHTSRPSLDIEERRWVGVVNHETHERVRRARKGFVHFASFRAIRVSDRTRQQCSVHEFEK